MVNRRQDPAREWHETHLAPTRHEEAVRDYHREKVALNWALARGDAKAIRYRQKTTAEARERMEREREG